MAAISAGDKVQLNSGGPVMTVSWTQAGDNGEEAFCDWFVKDELKQAMFVLTSLRRI